MNNANTPRRFNGTTLAVILAVAALGLFVLPTAASFRVPSTPAIIAIVDLEKLINECDEVKSLNKTLEAKYKKDVDQMKAWEKEGQDLVARIKDLPEDQRDERRKFQKQGTELQGKMKALNDFVVSSMEEEKATIIRNAYAHALAAIAAHAQKNNISLVTIDDQGLDIRTNAGMAEVNETIVRRRILYADKNLDITGEVLAILNRDFASGANKPKPAKK